MTLDDLGPGDKVYLGNPDRYTNTTSGDIYTVTRLIDGFVEITTANGHELVVEPADLRHA